MLRVVGVGGAGVNAVNRMVEAQVEGVEFVAVNTDLQSLQQSTADITLHIGPQVTRGLGAGSNPDLGRQSAMEEYDRIKALLKGSDMVFIAAGAGGGTGTGAAPIVARIARELGALTVGIVTKPFGFEGNRRSAAADMGVQALADEVDTLIVVPNNKLLSVLDKQTSMVDAFRVADDVLRQGVQGISDLVTLPGLINLDFADVRTIMSEAGNALLGIGMGHGEDRAVDAARAATESPLLETSMEGARKILLSITGGPGSLAVGDQRGGQGRQRGRAPRREHHLRRHGRREARLGGVGHRRRHRLHRGSRAPRAPRLRGAARRGPRRAPLAPDHHAPDRARRPRVGRSRVHSQRLTEDRYELPPARLERWLDRWAERHENVAWTSVGERDVAFVGADGERVVCEPPFPPLDAAVRGERAGYEPGPLLDHVRRERTVGVLLVRLGGHAAGVFKGEELTDSKVGSRLVHGRHRKGGSSSGRFARRREGEARAALQAAADVAVRVLVPAVARLDAVVLGGDRRALDEVMADQRLAPLRPLVADRVIDVPDPRLAVLRDTPQLFLATIVRPSGRIRS